MLLLDHPFIARLDEMVLVDNFYYLFMEYVDGGQLLDYIISHGKLKERQARQFARQIASALGKGIFTFFLLGLYTCTKVRVCDQTTVIAIPLCIAISRWRTF